MWKGPHKLTTVSSPKVCETRKARSLEGGLLTVGYSNDKPICGSSIANHDEMEFAPVGAFPGVEKSIEMQPDGGYAVRISSDDIGDDAVLEELQCNGSATGSDRLLGP